MYILTGEGTEIYLKKKIMPGVGPRVPLMHLSLWRMCEECLLSLGVQRFENYMGNNSGLWEGCLSASDGMAFGWF